MLTDKESAWFEDTKHIEGEDRDEHLKGMGLKSEDVLKQEPSGSGPRGESPARATP